MGPKSVWVKGLIWLLFLGFVMTTLFGPMGIWRFGWIQRTTTTWKLFTRRCSLQQLTLWSTQETTQAHNRRLWLHGSVSTQNPHDWVFMFSPLITVFWRKFSSKTSQLVWTPAKKLVCNKVDIIRWIVFSHSTAILLKLLVWSEIFMQFKQCFWFLM